MRYFQLFFNDALCSQLPQLPVRSRAYEIAVVFLDLESTDGKGGRGTGSLISVSVALYFFSVLCELSQDVLCCGACSVGV